MEVQVIPKDLEARIIGWRCNPRLEEWDFITVVQKGGS